MKADIGDLDPNKALEAALNANMGYPIIYTSFEGNKFEKWPTTELPQAVFAMFWSNGKAWDSIYSWRHNQAGFITRYLENANYNVRKHNKSFKWETYYEGDIYKAQVERLFVEVDNIIAIIKANVYDPMFETKKYQQSVNRKVFEATYYLEAVIKEEPFIIAKLKYEPEKE